MSTSSIGNFLSSSLSQVLLGALDSNRSTASVTRAQPATRTDSATLSPLARLLSTLQQLQQSDPAKYQQVTQSIAENLHTAAQTAQTNGNTNLANQLEKLSGDFADASKTGQLPNIGDLARAVGGHHGGHHARPARVDSDGDNDGSSSAPAPPASQAASAYQTPGTQTGDLNALNIILQTLKDAGVTVG